MKFISFTASSVAALLSVANAEESHDAKLDRLAMVVDRVTVTGERVEYSDLDTSTATKTLTPLVDIPQSITLITRDLIDDQAMRSMGDVVRYVPGVTMGQGEGHRDAPTLRGNSTTADFYVDGVRDDVQYFRDLYNAERIEILKGPNALIFGRGGGGGVINRVTKEADGERIREITLQGGNFGSARGSVDIGGAVSGEAALRFNAFYENSDSYRDFVGLERFGINPTGSLALTPDTDISLSYEYFNDRRDVDRGVPSENGLPYDGDRTAFFGDPRASYATADVHLATLAIEHRFSDAVTIRNRTVFADYDKFYQNIHANSPVAANGDVVLQGYNSGTDRQNLFNQTDLIAKFATGGLSHTLLIGGEIGGQSTANTRSANISPGTVNIADPTIFTNATFTAQQTDNDVDLFVASAYIQDQIDIGPYVKIVGGVRFDHFDLEIADNFTNAVVSRTDDVVSPRGGVIVKPMDRASLYFSYGKSFLPQSGDQFSSLSPTTAALEPEEFENLELGFKWDVTPGLEFAAAIYRLDRDNTRAIDPNTNFTVLTGAQRSKGFEASLAGAITDRWEILAGYAYTDARITRDTASAPAGRVAPLSPEHAFSLWNKYQATDRVAAGLGVVHYSDQFASISNAVTLPSYTRVDAALFYRLTDAIEAQVNVDNIFNELFFPTAHNDNNITPGAPRAVTVTLRAAL